MPIRCERPDHRAPWWKAMDTELVIRAQHGDEEAFASLAVAVGDRLHAVAHRILRDTDLAEDATQQALLSIWRDLPQLRDPARFDAWSYRLLVRACYTEGRRTRHWSPNLRLAAGRRTGPDDSTGRRSRSAGARVPAPVHRPSCGGGPAPLPRHAARGGRRDPRRPAGTVRSRLHHAMRGLRAALDADPRPVTREVMR